MRLPLDHVGIYGSDIHALRRAFTRLGFKVSKPVKLHAGTGDQEGEQLSAHIMFPDSYIELTSLRQGPEGHHLAAFANQVDAVRILVLACEDANAERQRLVSAGLTVSSVFDASRPLEHKPGLEAHFRWFSLQSPALQGTLTAWVEHRSRAEVFHPTLTTHPNSATGIFGLKTPHSAWPEPLLEAQSGTDLELRPDSRSDASINGLTIGVKRLADCTAVLEHNGIAWQKPRSTVCIDEPPIPGMSLEFSEWTPS